MQIGWVARPSDPGAQVLVPSVAREQNENVLLTPREGGGVPNLGWRPTAELLHDDLAQTASKLQPRSRHEHGEVLDV